MNRQRSYNKLKFAIRDEAAFLAFNESTIMNKSAVVYLKRVIKKKRKNRRI